MKAGRDPRELVHIYPTRPSGVAVCHEVALPVASSAAVVYGPKDATAPAHIHLAGDDASEFAVDLNTAQIDQAYLWVAGRPSDPTLAGMTVPPRKPLWNVCHGDSAAADALRAVGDRPPQRLRHI